jgi:DNA primase
MTSEFLKSRLNEDFIIDILFNLGCHSIKKQMFKGKPIICAGNPDGDNKGSINVYLDNFFVSNWTRPIFESRPFKDIITLVEFLENISYSQAIKRICEICGFDYYEREPETPAFLKWVNFVETGKQAKKKNDEIFRPLPERILNQFRLNPVKKWYDEGIKNTIQKDFQIGFDIDTERIIIPIRDELGTLVGVKGRLLRDSEGINDKYIYLYSCPKTQVLFGLYSNYKDIKKA